MLSDWRVLVRLPRSLFAGALAASLCVGACGGGGSKTPVSTDDGDKATADDGKLKVSFHHNLWEDVKERAPRVRFGQVHVYNNLHVARGEYGYSLGVGVQSRLFSEHNAWETAPEIATGRLVRLYRGSAFFDRGSLHNGRPVDLLAALRAANPNAAIAGDVGWQPVLHGPLDAAADVPARVRAGAGVGKLWTGPD